MATMIFWSASPRSLYASAMAISCPDDIDILLVGPTGANALILSDVGGATAASNITLTLSDNSGASLPDDGPLVSGTFKPTNIGAGDSFPSSAPVPTGNTLLS